MFFFSNLHPSGTNVYAQYSLLKHQYSVADMAQFLKQKGITDIVTVDRSAKIVLVENYHERDGDIILCLTSDFAIQILPKAMILPVIMTVGSPD